MNKQQSPIDTIVSYGKLTEVYQRIVDLEYEEIINPKTKSVIRALTRSTIFNETILLSDSVSLGIPIRDYLIKLRELGLLFMYLVDRAQPSFFYQGMTFYTLDTYLKVNKLQITDFRLRLYYLNGDILEALRTAKKRTNSVKSINIQYKGVAYNSIKDLANTFGLTYNTLVKRLKVCYLPNTSITIEEVIEELLSKKMSKTHRLY